MIQIVSTRILKRNIKSMKYLKLWMVQLNFSKCCLYQKSILVISKRPFSKSELLRALRSTNYLRNILTKKKLGNQMKVLSSASTNFSRQAFSNQEGSLIMNNQISNRRKSSLYMSANREKIQHSTEKQPILLKNLQETIRCVKIYSLKR